MRACQWCDRRGQPTDLSLTEVGEVAGRPEWIGRRKAGVLVAISNPSRASYGAGAGRGFAHKLKDLGTGREISLDAPTTFFLGQQGPSLGGQRSR